MYMNLKIDMLNERKAQTKIKQKSIYCMIHKILDKSTMIESRSAVAWGHRWAGKKITKG